jgi:hypothetical protein
MANKILNVPAGTGGGRPEVDQTGRNSRCRRLRAIAVRLRVVERASDWWSR